MASEVGQAPVFSIWEVDEKQSCKETDGFGFEVVVMLDLAVGVDEDSWVTH